MRDHESTVGFGMRVPSYPLDGADRPSFERHIQENLEAAVAGGLHSAWVSDHFIPWSDTDPDDSYTGECWTALCHYSALFPQLIWGPIVLCQSYRNPAVTAKMVAALSVYIPGHFVFGIGAGWKEREYRMLNIPFPSAAVRIKQLEEQVEIAKRLWTDDSVTYQGRYYRVQDCVVSPKPDPLPPIMIAGSGEQLLLRVVAKHADWWNFPGGTLGEFQHKLTVLEDHCNTIGRDSGQISPTWSSNCVAVAMDSAQAERIAQNSPFFAEDTAIFGTPDHLIDTFQERVDAGCKHFQLRFADFPETSGLELFCREVLPNIVAVS